MEESPFSSLLVGSPGDAQGKDSLARAELEPIPFRSGALALAAGPDSAAVRLGELARAPARRVVVQFDGPVENATRAELAQAGVELLHSLGANAYFASLTPGRVDPLALERIPALRRAEPVQAAMKLHPGWSEPPTHALVGLDAAGAPLVASYVVFHPDVAFEDGLALARRHGVVRDSISLVNGLVLEFPLARLLALANEDAVQWIEPPLPRLGEWNDSNRTRIGAATAQAAPYSLSGTGVSVLVYDGGYARATHQDFGGRLTVRDAAGLSGHATHVSGTIGGSGFASGGLRRGMAPKAS